MVVVKMVAKLTMSIYGFKTTITRSDGWYVGVIKQLHVVDQGKTLKVLEARLKEGAELALEELFKEPKAESRYFSRTVLRKLGMKTYA